MPINHFTYKINFVYNVKNLVLNFFILSTLNTCSKLKLHYIHFLWTLHSIVLSFNFHITSSHFSFLLQNILEPVLGDHPSQQSKVVSNEGGCLKEVIFHTKLLATRLHCRE